MLVEFIKARKRDFLHIDGYIYYFVRENGNKTYWKCRNQVNCTARAITSSARENIIVYQGPTATEYHDVSEHLAHAPNHEEVNSLKVMYSLKRSAKEHPEAPPAQILRNELQGIDSGVLSQLPDRSNLRKAITRERLKGMPSNPQRLEDLVNIPNEYRQTLRGDRFLLYDSRDDDDEDAEYGRILIFTTNADLKRLFRCNMWFADGTFSVAPTIFHQFFAIMGSVSQDDKVFALPFVYALLEDKQESSYIKIFEIVIAKARDFGICINMPAWVMTDFELGLINAVKKTIGDDRIRLCFFHLCQSVYRHIQSEGLQALYNDPDDRSIKTACHMLCALAFVPPDDVIKHFETLEEDIPDQVLPIADYLEVNYIRGRPARGRRRAVSPRYKPELWSQYQAVLDRTARTNNVSEGWHNRLQVIMGKKHPSMYAFLVELQKEQSDTTTMLEQLDLGQRVKPPLNLKRKQAEDRIFSIVFRYDEFIENDDILTFFRNLSYYITM